MREVYVLGIGQTVFGKHDDLSVSELGAAAALAAIKDAEISPKEFQVAFSGSAQAPDMSIQSILIRLGIGLIPMYNVGNACSSGSSAVHLLYREIALNGCDVGIALGVESLSAFSKMRGGKGLLYVEGDCSGKLALTMPAYFGTLCNRLMEDRCATIEDLCYPSVKNHKAGASNPYAQYKKVVTVEEIMASPMISDPITVLQCCPQSDGAAAIILCSKGYYKKHNRKGHREPVKIAGSAILSSCAEDSSSDPLALPVNVNAAKNACEMAGVDPQKDIDVVELHDAFSGEELAAYEMLGLCNPGRGVELARSRAVELGGRCPVNPSGGLLSMGHPLGASGVRVVNDITKQLWNEAGANQVEGAKVGMAQMLGGVLTGFENPIVAGVHILTK